MAQQGVPAPPARKPRRTRSFACYACKTANGAARRHPFQGLRYQHPTMAGYVGDAVTIRYDPRDLSEIRVFYRNEFLCRAVSEEHAGEAVTLKDIQAAR